MSSRKIRIRSNEIYRMSTTDLQQLTNNNTEADHDTLVRILRSSVNIEVYEDQATSPCPTRSPVDEDVDEDVDEHKNSSESDDVNQLDANANANQASSESLGEGTEEFLMDSKMPATENDIIPNSLTVGSANQPIETIEEAYDEEVEEESVPVVLPASASASASVSVSATPQDQPVG